MEVWHTSTATSTATSSGYPHNKGHVRGLQDVAASAYGCKWISVWLQVDIGMPIDLNFSAMPTTAASSPMSSLTLSLFVSSSFPLILSLSLFTACLQEYYQGNVCVCVCMCMGL